MSPAEFMGLLAATRDAQRLYHRVKGPIALREAKDYEVRLDAAFPTLPADLGEYTAAIEGARLMRLRQKAYWESRSPAVLRSALQAEAEVDRRLLEWIDNAPPAPPPQVALPGLGPIGEPMPARRSPARRRAF